MGDKKFRLIKHEASLGAGIWVIRCLTCGRVFEHDCEEPHNLGKVTCPGQCRSSEKWADVIKKNQR